MPYITRFALLLDGSAHAHFDDGAVLVLNPSAAAFEITSPSGEPCQQLCSCVTHTNRPYLRLALHLRNTLSGAMPCLLPDLIPLDARTFGAMPADVGVSARMPTELHWPRRPTPRDALAYPDGSVRVLSADRYASLLLHRDKQLFCVHFPAPTACEHFEVHRKGHSAGPPTPLSRPTLRPATWTFVKQLHNVACVVPPCWEHALHLALEAARAPDVTCRPMPGGWPGLVSILALSPVSSAPAKCTGASRVASEAIHDSCFLTVSKERSTHANGPRNNGGDEVAKATAGLNASHAPLASVIASASASVYVRTPLPPQAWRSVDAQCEYRLHAPPRLIGITAAHHMSSIIPNEGVLRLLTPFALFDAPSHHSTTTSHLPSLTNQHTYPFSSPRACTHDHWPCNHPPTQTSLPPLFRKCAHGLVLTLLQDDLQFFLTDNGRFWRSVRTHAHLCTHAHSHTDVPTPARFSSCERQPPAAGDTASHASPASDAQVVYAVGGVPPSVRVHGVELGEGAASDVDAAARSERMQEDVSLADLAKQGEGIWQQLELIRARDQAKCAREPGVKHSLASNASRCAVSQSLRTSSEAAGVSGGADVTVEVEIAGVGRFRRFADGHVSGNFADRTILTSIPGEAYASSAAAVDTGCLATTDTFHGSCSQSAAAPLGSRHGTRASAFANAGAATLSSAVPLYSVIYPDGRSCVVRAERPIGVEAYALVLRQFEQWAALSPAERAARECAMRDTQAALHSELLRIHRTLLLTKDPHTKRDECHVSKSWVPRYLAPLRSSDTPNAHRESGEISSVSQSHAHGDRVQKELQRIATLLSSNDGIADAPNAESLESWRMMPSKAGTSQVRADSSERDPAYASAATTAGPCTSTGHVEEEVLRIQRFLEKAC